MGKLTNTLALSLGAVVLLSGSAMAADLAAPMKSAPMMAAPAASGDWDGLYVGASVGYGWGTAMFFTAPTTSFPSNLSGLFVGGQVGYNFHLADSIVAGIEGNLDWSNEQGHYTSVPTDTSRINWSGSVRGRLGYDAGQFLPYAEAGVAFAAEDENYGTDHNSTFVGWTAGAGVEFKLTDTLSANVEYRYSDYGTQVVTGSNVTLTDNTIRLGINYHL